MAPDWLLGIKLPLVLGGDVAGVVLEADEGSAFKPGDRVWGLMPGSRGSYASVVALPEAALAQIPEGMSFEDAAACPLTGLTAWQVGVGQAGDAKPSAPAALLLVPPAPLSRRGASRQLVSAGCLLTPVYRDSRRRK